MAILLKCDDCGKIVEKLKKLTGWTGTYPHSGVDFACDICEQCMREVRSTVGV